MSELDQAFGQAVRRCRHKLGLSQEVLGFRAGIHRTYISQIERGMKSPSLNVIEKLAIALDVDIVCLIQLTEEIRQHK